MNDQWSFEPCDPEGALSPRGVAWPYATRGRKIGGTRPIYGYGDTQPAADIDARESAQRYDARDMLGLPQPGEVAPVDMQSQTRGWWASLWGVGR